MIFESTWLDVDTNAAQEMLVHVKIRNLIPQRKRSLLAKHLYVKAYQGITFGDEELTVELLYSTGDGAKYQIDVLARPVPHWTVHVADAQAVPIIHELFGNPFRKSLPFSTWEKCNYCKGYGILSGINVGGNPCSKCNGKGKTLFLGKTRSWNDDLVGKLAMGIYEDNAFERCPILSDALEEAGCQDEEVLNHLRGKQRCPTCLGQKVLVVEYAEEKGGPEQGLEKKYVCPPPKGSVLLPCLRCNQQGWIPLKGPHLRGCWAIDLILEPA